MFQKRGQLLYLLWLLSIEIVLLGEILAEVIEFASMGILRVAVGFVEPRWNLADRARGSGNQHPIAVAESITVRVRIVHERLANAAQLLL